MKIQFTDVGRGNWCGNIGCPDTDDPDVIAEVACREAGKHLASRFPEMEYDGSINEGKIFAGFHCVGEFKVIP